jgi:parallel beta-helix repeat protein
MATINVTQSPYSAVGNGSTDDATALQAALDALAVGDSLIIPAGKTFNHSTALTVGTAGVNIYGGGTLRGTTQATSAVLVNANNVRIEDIALTLSSRSGRGSSLNETKLTINQVSGVVLRNLNIASAYGYGIYARGATGWLIDSCRVSNTGADGIHINGGNSGGRIYNCAVTNPEDDGIGMVSDDSDASAVTDIVIRGFRMSGQTLSGRGIACVGATNVLVENAEIVNSYGAGIIVATEQSYLTRGNSNIRFYRCTLRGSNTAAGTVNHGAILVNNSRSTGTTNIDDVSFADIDIIDTNASASASISTLRTGTDAVTNVRYRDIRFTGTGPASIGRESGTPGTSYVRLMDGGSQALNARARHVLLAP